MKETFYEVYSWGDREFGYERTYFFKTIESALDWIKSDSKGVIKRYQIRESGSFRVMTEVQNTWPTVEDIQQYGNRIIINNGNVYTGCFKIYTCQFED